MLIYNGNDDLVVPEGYSNYSYSYLEALYKKHPKNYTHVTHKNRGHSFYT